VGDDRDVAQVGTGLGGHAGAFRAEIGWRPAAEGPHARGRRSLLKATGGTGEALNPEVRRRHWSRVGAGE
jgi:hypothetical protein